MKYLKQKDKKKRLFFQKAEPQIIYIKYCLQKNFLNLDQRIYLTEILHHLGKNNSACKIRNRCVLAGKSRSVNRQFKISRMPLREILSLGLVPGFRKAVW